MLRSFCVLLIQFIAFYSTAQVGPGGVNNNLKIWLKAGSLSSSPVANWPDQSGLSNNFLQGTGSLQPSWIASDLNFNPSVNFSASGDIMSPTSSPLNANTTIFTVAAPRANSNWRTMFRGNVSDHPIIVESGGTRLGYYDNDNTAFTPSGFTWLENEPAVVGLEMRSSPGNDVNFRKNGTQGASITSINLTSPALNLDFLGNYQGGTQPFGRIAEVIVFTDGGGSPLITTEKERIESYLGIKYGVTLTHNYLASDGSSLWNVTTNAGYNNNITGIGRDDNSVLSQTKSKSVNSGSVVTMEHSGSFGTDKNFLLWGNDGGTGSNASIPTPTYTIRSGRTWKTALNGPTVTVSIDVDLAVLGLVNTGNFADYSLLRDTDNDFTSGSTPFPASSMNVAGGIVTFTGVNFNSASNFFTIAVANVKQPGGVGGIAFWVKGDAGISASPVSSWSDQSGYNDLVQPNPALQPAQLTNSVNFNPAVNFSTISTIMSPTVVPPANNSTVFTVAVPAVNTFWRTMLRGTLTEHHLIIEQGGTRLGYYDNNNGGFQASGFNWLENETALVSVEMRSIPGNNVNFRKNGTQGVTISSIDLSEPGGGLDYFGNYQGNDQHFGKIAETIVYNTATALTTPEKERIESYLAIKYGLSLTHNYTASDATTIHWDLATHPTYNNNIVGIGRDDKTGLDQRKSKSSNASSALTLEKTLSGIFPGDLNFLVAGSDTGSLGATTSGVSSDPLFPMRVERVWVAHLTGSPGHVDISFDLGSGIYNSNQAADYALLLNNTSNFTGVAPTMAGAGTILSNVITFADVDLTDGTYFTLALPFVNSPGNVITNLKVWLKADAGIAAPDGGTVGQWDDQTSLANNATASGTPIHYTSTVTPANLINFNPTVYYDGASGHNLTYSSSGQYTMFTMARMEGTQNLRVFSSTTSNSLLGYWNGREDVLYLNGTPSLLTGQPATTNPRLYTLSRASNGAYNFYKNGATLASGGGGSSNDVPWQFGIANGGVYPGEKSKVYVSELIVYDRNLSATEINSVQSYLGIKYGVTLDQSSPTNYVASDGTVIWNASAGPAGNASYASDIAGIGRDDNSTLNQIKSQSINARSVVSIEASSFTTDKTFLVWGGDNKALSPTSVNTSSPFPYRVGKTWRVDMTGTTGPVSVSFDLGVGIFNSGIPADYALIKKNSDANFSSGATNSAPPTFNGSIITFTNITFMDGDYFTLGLPNITAPGGVVGNVQLWLKANTGVTNDGSGFASAWTDQSGNGFNMTQPTGATRPAINASQSNFNPVVSFDGTNDFMTRTAGIMGTATYTDFNAIIVSKANANTTNTLFYEDQAAGGRINTHIPWNNSNIYWDAGDASNDRLNGNWGGAIGINYLWTMTASTVATASGARQDIYRNGLRIAADNTESAFTGNNSNFYLGSQIGNYYFGGELSEVVFYTGSLSTNQLQRINSYLSLKYGLTLDQSAPQNYIASNSAVLYHATTTHAGYVNSIAGIGRDDNSALDQRKSKTANTPADIFTASNNNFITPAAFGTDLQFLVWGHNGLSATSDAAIPSITHAATSIVRRLSRVWSTDKSGTPTGDLIIEMEMGQIGGPSGPGTNATADLRLLLDGDGTFGNASSGEKVYTVSSTSGSKIYFTVPYIDLPAQGFLTLGSTNLTTAPLLTPTPGGIATNLRLWLKGDLGATPSSWTDNSGNSYNATQLSGGNQPSVVPNRLNFNPSVVFNGTNQNLVVSSGILAGNTYTDAYVFVVSRANTALQSSQLFFESTLASQFTSHHPWSDGQVYWDAGDNATNRLNGNWGGLLNQSYLWSLTGSTTATPSGASQDIYRNGLRFLNDNSMITFIGSNNPFYVGSGANNYYSNAEISELIVIGSSMNTSQFQRVHSYLAIKYGFTLDQTTTQNYFSSTDAVIYHATTTHSAYSKNITGIGRDDNSALSQLKSKSSSTSQDLITMANGDFATPAAFSGNHQFFIWGSNGLPYSADPATVAYTHNGASIARQFARVWSTDKTGTPSGNIVLEIDMNLVGGPSGAGSNANAAIRLLIDGDGTFGNASSGELALSPDGGYTATGGKIYFTIPYTSFALSQNFFTIGSVNAVTAPISIPYPGGVSTNIKLWLKANAGVTGGATAATWSDQSNNGFVATSSSQPVVLDENINFNKSLQFNGSTQMIIGGGVLGTTTYSDINAFVVDKATAGGGQVFQEGTNVGAMAAYIPWVDNNIYWDVASGVSPYRLSTNWGGTLSTPYLWSLTGSTTATSTGARQDIFRNALRITNDTDMSTFTGTNSNFNIGFDGGGTFHRGETSEIVLYTGALTATQMQRIHSYLALKYGLTLDQTFVAQDYLASNAAILYHATSSHNGYRSDIAGIGRDDDSALDQRKSKSVNAGAAVIMEKSVPGSIFTTDKDFLIWGDDGLSNGPTTVGAVNGTYPMRTMKTWRVDTNGSPGTVTLSFDFNSGIYNSTVAADYALLIKNSNNDFTTGASINATGTLSLGILTFTNVTFTDGDYFTLGMPRVPAPGGVIANLRVWLKANTGVYSDAGTTPAVNGGSVQQWKDQTQLGNNATNTGSPTFYSPAAASSSLINYNPTVYYDGTSGHSLTYNVSGQYTIFTMSRMEGTLNRRLFSSIASNYLLSYWNGLEDVWYLNGSPSFLSGITATTTPRLYATIRSSGGGYQMLKNGASLYAGSGAGDPPMQFSMGNGGQSNESSRAFVSESIIYDRNLNATELNAVQSYLAIKYGITLDQTSPANYVTADGTVTWDASANTAYKYNLAGIGRDDRSALDQRKSKSVNTNSVVAIEKATPASAFATDKDFIVWGSDASMLSPTTSGKHPSYPYRVSRIWRASVRGTATLLTVSFDLNDGIYNSTVNTDYALLINNTAPSFTSGATADATGIISGGVITFSNIVLPSGAYFTLGLPNVPAPGGVANGMQLWVKANAGTTGSPVSAWADQSGNNFSLIQNTGSSQPAFLSSDINYNPSVQFDGGNDQLVVPAGIMGTNTYNNLHSFMLARTNVITTSLIFYENQNSGGRINVHLPWTDNNVYWDAGSFGATQRLFTPWGGAVGTNYLWGFTSSTGVTPSGARQDIYRDGLRIANDADMTAFTGNNSPFYLGSGGGGSYYNGAIAEDVIYTSALSLQELQRIQSYFGVKYGITLNQATAQNYYASDWNGTAGTLLWNSTSAGAYKNDIAAIGRDNNSALHQKQSASINTGNVLAISSGATTIPASNALNASTLTNMTFFSWAHNNLVLDGEAITDLPATIESRIARVWQGQETGTVGTVRVKFNLSTVMGAGEVVGNNDMDKVRLLIDADGVFAAGATIVPYVAFDNTAHTVEFDVNFPDGIISYFTVGSIDKNLAPLPIQLVSFTATPKEDKVWVAWKTLTELDNDFFTVQSSVDGLEWGAVQEVKGAGNSSKPKTYEIIDETPFIGKSYYRLKQTDFNGKTAYSKAVEVTINEGSIKVFPNPVSEGKINIQINDNLSEQVQIRLLDSQQRELKSQTFKRNTSQQSTISMDLPEQLPSGMYYLKIVDKTGIHYKRIIVN